MTRRNLFYTNLVRQLYDRVCIYRKKSGNINDKKYDEIWKMATYLVAVNNTELVSENLKFLLL
ncbi:MAG: hypothetical protein ABI793_12650 [Flavobacterium sp.]